MLQSRGRGLTSTLPGGERVRVLPAFRYLSWNPVEYAAFRAAVGPGHVALDVGANVGAYSLLLGQWVGRTGAVYAFEPSPDMYEGLVQHVRLNALDGVVRPVAAAVADRDGRATLLEASTAGERRLALDRSEPGMTVATVSIDSFCARHRLDPSFIKIDVEGFELDALRGARDTIRRCRDAALFVELHPSIWPELGVTRQDILDELAHQGLNAFPVPGAADPWSTEGVAVRLRHR
jgi:FkbM family methyltransferase